MVFFPEVAHAAATQAETITSTLLAPIVTYILDPLTTLLTIFATVVFIWGAAGLILHGDDADKRADAQRHILWGVIGIFIMIAVFGIVRFVGNSVGVTVPLFN